MDTVFLYLKSKDTDWAWKTLTVSLLSAQFVSFLLEDVMPTGVYVRTEATRKKMSKAKKGNIPWHKGKTGVYSKETLKKMKTAQIGNKHPNWKGGKTKDGKGYVLTYHPNHPFRDKQNYVREHRLVMEKMIDRYLTPEEISHHKNGIRDDNRPENLRLFATGGKHTAFHLLQKRNKQRRKSDDEKKTN